MPIIVVILIATHDLARLGQLSDRANKSAQFAVEHFSQAAVLSEKSILDTALALEKITMEHPYVARTVLSVMAIEVHGQNGQKVIWTRTHPDNAGSCSSDPHQFEFFSSDEENMTGIHYFYQLDLCLEAQEALFLSGLSFLEDEIRGTAILLARSPAIRQFQ